VFVIELYCFDKATYFLPKNLSSQSNINFKKIFKLFSMVIIFLFISFFTKLPTIATVAVLQLLSSATLGDMTKNQSSICVTSTKVIEESILCRVAVAFAAVSH
jgi:hypothetical protein